uniref:Ig-like domain-containing protein n=1 Tax=Maylandia zebra TaxID=106582 RepID=A0A3P9B315_9CICH
MKLRVGGLLSNLTCSQFQRLTSICSVLFPLSDQKTITAESEQNVTLTCRAANNNPISVVKWSRADLRDEYVLLYQNNNIDPENQHPSFEKRVHLLDRQMKDGDVSLILKNVTINDTGTYECVQQQSRSTKVEIKDKIITAESGQNVTLTCRAPQGKPIRAVKWSRADLGDKYVLLYRDELFDQTSQHPSFQNRVDLQDRQMKDGDVSLILKDVTINDAGTYECRVIVGESASWEIVGTVKMSVLPPGDCLLTHGGWRDKGYPYISKCQALQRSLKCENLSFCVFAAPT